METSAPSTPPRKTGCRSGLIYVISAPSGAGKTSICKEILKMTPGLQPSVSYTTRRARTGELDGFDYHFVDKEEFMQMVADDKLAEWAEVHGNCYGTARHTLEEAARKGEDVLLEIDYQGAEQLRNNGVDGVFIFILPPDMNELRKRLDIRNTDDEEVIERRMANAREEIAASVTFDYLVINDVLESAIDRVKAIMVAESLKKERVIDSLPEEFGLK